MPIFALAWANHDLSWQAEQNAHVSLIEQQNNITQALKCIRVSGVCIHAGFFLFAVQPFRLGDRIAVRSMASGESAAASPGPTGGWYEGSCEQVDLRQAPTHLSLALQYQVMISTSNPIC